MRLQRDRRGMVYLIGAILLVAVFLTLYFARTLPTERERTESITARIITIDDFLKDLHEDVPRAAYIAGYRAILAMEEYVAENGFLAEPAPKIIEAFLNGTIEGKNYSVMRNSTFLQYLGKVNEETSRVGIRLNITLLNVSLTQRTPWSIDLDFNMTMNVSDRAGLARWDYERSFRAEVPILDTRDPLYIVYTFGRVPNTFRMSPYEHDDLVNGNDTSNLYNESINMYYREDPYAPSFMQRLTGNISANSKYGISSVVNLDSLDTQGIFVYTYRSVIDYLYFTNASTTNYCHTFGSPMRGWFKIDATHYFDEARNYELDDLNATVC